MGLDVVIITCFKSLATTEIVICHLFSSQTISVQVQQMAALTNKQYGRAKALLPF